MKIQNNFLKATVNKDLDERLTPNGQMVDSENFMVKSEDDSNAGVGKNVLGNTQKTNLGIVGGETIGSEADGSRDRIFYLVAGDLFDYLIVWNLKSNTSEILLQSTAGTGVLNLSKEYRVSHIDIFESDEDSYLISWTDGFNPPRIVNVDRASEYGIDGFTEEEISTIKAPPRVDIQATPTQSTNNQDSNFIKDKFLCFAYRYKFKDGFFSAISSWTAPQFIPSRLEIDPETGYNKGMINSANAVDLIFNTGSREVVEVDLLFKETNSSLVYVIDKFNKEDEGWSDNVPETFEFNNSKIYLPLPESQYFRNFDNVPLIASTQAKIGSRLVYGDYEEGRDIDIDGKIDFDVDVVSEAVNENSYTATTIIQDTPFALSNKIFYDTATRVSGSTNDFLDLNTGILNINVIDGATVTFKIDIDLTEEDCNYKIVFDSNIDGIQESSLFDNDGNDSYIFTNNTGSDVSLIVTSFIKNVFGNVKYNVDANLKYTEAGSFSFEYDYSSDFKIAYSSSLGSSTAGNQVYNGTILVDLDGFEFEKDSVLFIDYVADPNLNIDSPDIFGSLFYILEDDYSNVQDFYNNSGFKNYIEGDASDSFEENNTTGGEVYEFTGFTCELDDFEIKISMPITIYKGKEDLENPDARRQELYPVKNVDAYSTIGGAFTSLHSNRDYEVSMLYMDKQGRKTTALTSKENTIYIPNNKSTEQNKLKITVNHNPPSWADRYKFAVKQVKGNYDTIFSNVFYIDGLYVWFKVIGSNRIDLKEGDELIVKRDSDGALDSNVVKATILEVKTQEKDFILDNKDDLGLDIVEQSGTYFKIIPDGFSVTSTEETKIITYDEDRKTGNNTFPRTYNGVGEWVVDDENSNVPNEVPLSIIVGDFSIYRAKVLSGLSYYDSESGSVKDNEIALGSSIRVNLKSKRTYKSRADGNTIFDKTYFATRSYSSFKEFFDNQIQPEMPLQPTNGAEDGNYEEVEVVRGFIYYKENESTIKPGESFEFIESDEGYLFLKTKGIYNGNGGSVGGRLYTELDIKLNNVTLCFETEPIESIEAPFYETPETYEVIDGQHEFTEHILTETFNCYAFGNGVESHQIQDKFNEKYVSLNAVPTAVSEDEYRRIRRYADLTYSGVFQPNTNVNSLNEFNLSQANFKDDIEKRYGKIVKLYPNETDLLVIQEDKWSKVLYGKDLLFNSDATTNLSRIAEVLGQQVMYGGEYGISKHPESFDEYSFNNYCTDVNRGVVMRKNNANGLSEISNYGMTDYFKKLFRDNDIVNIIGAYDAFYDVYFLNIKYNTNQYVTWVFSDSDKGFLTRATFNPEDMVRLNNEFISFKNGDVYLHNNGEYNTFYGVQSPSKFSFNFSQEPSTRKLFRNISIEGTDSWNIDLKTDLQEGFINKVDFKKKEGVWYGYVRGEEGEVDLATLSVQGIGQISEIVGDTISFVTDVPSIISVGDVVYNTSMLGIGNITNKTSNSITLNSVVGLSVSDFVLSTKPQSIETSGLLGYYMRVDAELTSDEYSEVFAVNSEVSKSFE